MGDFTHLPTPKLGASAHPTRAAVVVLGCSPFIYAFLVMLFFIAFDWLYPSEELASKVRNFFVRADQTYFKLRSISGNNSAENYLAVTTSCLILMPIMSILTAVAMYLVSKDPAPPVSFTILLRRIFFAFVALIVPNGALFAYMHSETLLQIGPELQGFRIAMGAFLDIFLICVFLVVWNSAMLHALLISTSAETSNRQ